MSGNEEASVHVGESLCWFEWMKLGVKCVCLQYALLNACYAVVIWYDDNAEHKSACIRRKKIQLEVPS